MKRGDPLEALNLSHQIACRTLEAKSSNERNVTDGVEQLARRIQGELKECLRDRQVAFLIGWEGEDERLYLELFDGKSTDSRNSTLISLVQLY